MLADQYVKRLEDRLGICFSQQFRAALGQGEVQYCSFPARTIVLREGESSDAIYYILKGIVRGYYISEEGEEVTKCFSLEEGFFASEGFRGATSSSFYIETLEECECLRISYDFLHRSMLHDEELARALQKILFDEIQRLEVRSKHMMLLDAKERYLVLQKEEPELVKRVQKQYIASYIGIKPGSLSRIMKSF